MPGRHLRRPRGWWLRRALLVLVVLAVGAAIGAGASLLLEDPEGGDVRAGGSGTAALAPDVGPVRIVLAGELRPGWALAGRLDAPPTELLPSWADAFEAAALTVVELSGAVLTEAPPDPGTAAWAPASVLDGLAATGVDVVALATPRTLDLGPSAVFGSLGAADGQPVRLVGIGADEADAYAPLVRDVAGQAIAVLSATQVLDPARIATDTAGADSPGVASAKRVDRLVAAVEAAQEQADVVVVYVHWGDPGQTCPNPSQVELASALVEAGADVVAGTGTGTVQGVGRLDGAVVAYGLGSLVADGGTEAGALAVDVVGGEVDTWSWLPGQVVDGVAEPVGDVDGAARDELDARRTCAGLDP